MSRKIENTGFICLRCGLNVVALTNGSYRNHCPRCLYSRHVDVHPGDRASSCRGLMKPMGLAYKSKKGWQVIHHCETCSTVSLNKIAANTVQPDEPMALAKVQSY